MLERQQHALRDDARDAAPRLPVSLSGEINAATRYDPGVVSLWSQATMLIIHVQFSAHKP